MRGPPPKPASLRQRRNKKTTRAKLSTDGTGREPPSLPKREIPCSLFGCSERCRSRIHSIDWHPLTLAFWKSTWESPMATEYLDADIPGLFRLAELIDQFWVHPTTALAAEIRLQQQAYGLTPLDRRRLEWEVEKVTAVQKKRMPPPSPKKRRTGDAYGSLRVVS